MATFDVVVAFFVVGFELVKFDRKTGICGQGDLITSRFTDVEARIRRECSPGLEPAIYVASGSPD